MKQKKIFLGTTVEEVPYFPAVCDWSHCAENQLKSAKICLLLGKLTYFAQQSA